METGRNLREMNAGCSGYPLLHGEFEVSQGYKRLCLSTYIKVIMKIKSSSMAKQKCDRAGTEDVGEADESWLVRGARWMALSALLYM